MLSGYDTLLHVPVSLPRIDCLIEGIKYMESHQVQQSDDPTERRPAGAPPGPTNGT